MKYCIKCKTEKEFSEFHKNNSAKDKLHTYCKKCSIKLLQTPEARKKNAEYCKSEKYKAYKKAYRLSPEGKKKEQEYLSQDRIKKSKRARFLCKFWPGSSKEEAMRKYHELLLKQDNKCALCFIHQSDLDSQLCVDHCHKNGKVRGLLCQTCNRAIGLLKDSTEILVRAACYIKINNV